MSAIYVKQVLKELKDNGFYELDNRTNGSHHRYTDGNGHYVSVAYYGMKDIIPPGTYKSIRRQMGL
ncbi:type II toxin-antitoxin system HicA family toxin [Enterococcus faecium]|uniref:type II toxin-antitoxin system HicA family toxin n=1 Tax=Enterococcus faecium TaxID=1352 RepID=UPI0035179AFF